MRAYPPPGLIGPRAIAWWSLRALTSEVSVEGLEHVPRYGPVLLVAHHYHHLLDGAVLVHHLGRPLHIVVGLDWAAGAGQRRWMERLCRWAHYPVILRPPTTGERGGYTAAETARYLRTGLRGAAALLGAGRVVLVFPEGYPVIDPAVSAGTPQTRDGAGFLPFARGFRTIADLARRLGAADLAVIPVGFGYRRRGRRWAIRARIGAPLAAGAGTDEVERAVRELSS